MSKKIRISLLLALDTVFAIIELTTGYMVHSLALVADSFHMFNDILSLIVALWAVTVSDSGSSPTFSYGLQRAEVLGALINAVFLLALCVTIILEAIERFINPPEISNPVLILVVGILGLLSNIVGLFLFHEHGHSHGGSSESEHSHEHSHHDVERQPLSMSQMLPEAIIAREEHRLMSQNVSYGATGSHNHSHGNSDTAPSSENDVVASNVHEPHSHSHDTIPNDLETDHNEHHHAKPKVQAAPTRSMNMEGVFLHVLGDALGNVGVIITALFIWKTNYWWRFYSDPMVSLFITAIIFSTAIPLCIRASKVLLQATPSSINGAEVAEDIMSLPGVEDIHDLHIWQLSEHQMIATLHVTVNTPPIEFTKLAKSIQECFAGYGIPTLTIQPEFVRSVEDRRASVGLRQCQSNGNLLAAAPN